MRGDCSLKRTRPVVRSVEVARYLTGFHDGYRVRRGIDKSNLLEIHKGISNRNTNNCRKIKL